MKTEVVMMLKAEVVVQGGIETVKDEATLEQYAKAINAYPKLVEALRTQIAKFHEYDEPKMAEPLEAILREIGEMATTDGGAERG